MANAHVTATVLGTIDGKPPYVVKSGGNPLTRFVALPSPSSTSFSTNCNFYPVSPAQRYGSTNYFVNAAIEVPATGLNIAPQIFGVYETVTALASAAG